MDTDPKNFWMVIKTSWAPQPRWLSAEVDGLDCVCAHAATVRAPAQLGRQTEPARITAFNSEAAGSFGEEAPSRIKEKRKIHRELRFSGSARVKRDLAIELVQKNTLAEQAIGPCRPAQETASTPNIRSKKRKIPMGNVVELRPRHRDEIYATDILNALCAACEAHAAGEDELLMARIKTLYHMFGHMAR